MLDPFLARSMVETLSRGINPVTGQVLSYHDSCSNEEIQEALLEVLDHCTIESVEQYILRGKGDEQAARDERAAANAQRYPRGGQPWSSQEEQKLLSMLRRGKNIYQIANVLKRTPRAVSERMRNLECVPVHRSKKRDDESQD